MCVKALLMQFFLFTYENEHHCYVLESIDTHQIFWMPLCIMFDGDHLINEYWECPQSEKICILKIKFNDQTISEVVNCFSEKSAKSLQTFSESNMIVRQFTKMVGMKNITQELTLSLLQIKVLEEYWAGQKGVNRALTRTPE